MFSLFHTKRKQPVFAGVLPITEPFEIGSGLAEKFKLHLFKLTGAEDEVAGVISLRKDFPTCPTPNGIFLRGGALNICKVDKDPLCRFRTKIDFIFGILSNALKVLNIRLNLRISVKFSAAAVRAFNAFLLNKIHHLLIRPTVRRNAGLSFDELIRTMACFAVPAVHQRIGKPPT